MGCQEEMDSELKARRKARWGALVLLNIWQIVGHDSSSQGTFSAWSSDELMEAASFLSPSQLKFYQSFIRRFWLITVESLLLTFQKANRQRLRRLLRTSFPLSLFPVWDCKIRCPNSLLLCSNRSDKCWKQKKGIGTHRAGFQSWGWGSIKATYVRSDFSNMTRGVARLPAYTQH